MKIGILTLPIHENYGGILQAVALYRLLHSKGHDVVLVDKQTKNNQVLWKKLVRKVLLKIPFHDFKNLRTNYKIKKEHQKTKIQRLSHQESWSEAVTARYIKYIRVFEKVNILITYPKRSAKQIVFKVLNFLKVNKR